MIAARYALCCASAWILFWFAAAWLRDCIARARHLYYW